MNIEKWTAKMQEAIQKAITMASEMGHQVVDVEHFLLALLEDNAGILYRVLSKANVNIADLQNKLNVRLQGKPIVSNVDINSIRISYDLNQLLSLADKQMHNFKDEYLSVEHLIMALFELNSSWLKAVSYTHLDVYKRQKQVFVKLQFLLMMLEMLVEITTLKL